MKSIFSAEQKDKGTVLEESMDSSIFFLALGILYRLPSHW